MKEFNVLLRAQGTPAPSIWFEKWLGMLHDYGHEMELHLLILLVLQTSYEAGRALVRTEKRGRSY
jgi:hypothetical protein